MDMQELVSAIVREVWDNMQGEQQQPCVLVLARRDQALPPHIQEQLHQDLEEHTNILFLDDELGGRTPARHILPSLSCSDMADLAQGKAFHPVMNRVLELLLRGTTVETLEFEYKRYQNSAPAPLYALYRSYEKALIAYGLTAFHPQKPGALRLQRSLITENDVRQAHEQGIVSLVVPSAAIVTPLAVDYATERNITIRHC